MLGYSEIRQKKVIIYEGEPHEVVDSHVFRMQQRKPVNQVKLRNLITGRQVQTTFHQSDKVEEAELGKKTLQYLYEKRGEYWFASPSDKSDRHMRTAEVLGDNVKYIKPNEEVTALVFEDEIIGIDIPIKVVLEVTEAPPNVKGNTAQGCNKTVIVETGLPVVTPLFIEAGDLIEINTTTGEYVTRVEKA